MDTKNWRNSAGRAAAVENRNRRRFGVRRRTISPESLPDLLGSLQPFFFFFFKFASHLRSILHGWLSSLSSDGRIAVDRFLFKGTFKRKELHENMLSKKTVTITDFIIQGMLWQLQTVVASTAFIQCQKKCIRTFSVF